MPQLIVNADDLGAGPGRDRGIARAFEEGVVTSASLLATGPSFAVAARLARDLALPLGVHLNLSEGAPLCGPIPGLTAGNGEFPGKEGLRRALAAGRPDPEGVGRELAAQVARVRDAGLEPDHLDTHQHFALFPAGTRAVLETARASGIRAQRLPAPAEPAADDPPGPLGRELALYRRLAPAAARRLRESGLATPAGLWGMPLLDRLDEARLLAALERLPAGTWELMVHPGYAEGGNAFSGPAREAELAALTSPLVRDAVARLGIRLVAFGDLPCAS